jgi:Beta-lactamase
MADTTYTVEAIEAAPDHAEGHVWSPDGTRHVGFTAIFPFQYGGAGDLNSNVEDMARWLRLQIGDGAFDGRRIVSAENMAVTRTSKVAVTPTVSYNLGWMTFQTPNAALLFHDGDTLSFGAFVGLQPERKVGVVILMNAQNVGFPDALGIWILDRILGNPETDYIATTLAAAKTNFAATEARFARPADPRPQAPPATLAGEFSSPSLGHATLTENAGALVLRLEATGARLRLEPWDGDVFTFRLLPEGRFARVVELGYMNQGFAQFLIGGDGKRDVLRLGFVDGQQIELKRR